MTTEYKQLVIRYVEEVNRGNFDAFDTLVDPAFIDHDPIPGQQPGIPGLKDAYRQFLTAFPDIHFTFEDVFCEGDLVVGRGVIHGTHRGTFMGMAPTGRRVRWTGTRLFRVRGGQVTEGWINLDLLGLVAQLSAPSAQPLPAEVGPGDIDLLARPVPPNGGTPEQNKPVFRRMIMELWNQKWLDMADVLFTPGATSPTAPNLPPGPSGVKQLAGMFLKAIPDLHIEIEQLVAEGDRVFGRLRETGTHTGDLVTPAGIIKATNKPVSFTEMAIVRFEDGRIAESWYDVDMAGLLMQIGAVPGPS
ncbi:ester cyclase [Corallococcus macrosporus]|uniref:Ester cyclase n=1 Tax=Corallococcus macrosporus TaxID=35 RepID=A0ABS3DJP8_9BACT|nr:ester cyclase [Corallococcus macrosporus]MBN8231539.1 ester cyclase [Corallococcus macrosporus]